MHNTSLTTVHSTVSKRQKREREGCKILGPEGGRETGGRKHSWVNGGVHC